MPANGNSETLRADLAVLVKLLESGDATSQERFLELREQLGQFLDLEQLTRIQKLIERFEFDEASAELKLAGCCG